MDLLGLRYKLSSYIHSECIKDISDYICSGKTLTTLFGEREIHLNRRIGYYDPDQTLYTLYQGEGIQIDFEIGKGYTLYLPTTQVQTTDWDEVKQAVSSYI